MYNATKSYRFKVIRLFVVSILFMSIIMMIALPLYFTNTMKKEQEILIDSTLVAVEYNLNSYFDELERLTIMPYYNQDFLDGLMMVNSSQYEELTDYEQFLINQSIEYTLSYYLQNTRDDIVNALFITNDHHTFITTKKYGITSLKSAYRIEETSWYKELLSSQQNFTFMNAHSQSYLGNDEKVFSIARLIKDPITQKQLGVLMADMDTVILSKLLNEINLGVNTTIVILDGEGQSIYSTSEVSKTLIQKLKEDDSESIIDSKDKYQVINRRFEKLPWEINVLLSETETFRKISGMYIVGGGIVLLGVVIVLVLYTVMSRRLTDPINEMLYTIKIIEEGQLETRFEVNDSHEFIQLSHSLNSMLDEINQLINREYQATIEKQRAEFHALQSQIQPHFLYNILTGLMGLNRLGERDKIETTIINLTKQMRYILEQNDNSTLDDEFRLLRSYCELQQLRFGERLSFEFTLEESLKKYLIPKLLLQPIVENAIIHGLEKKGSGGQLTIKAERIQSTESPNKPSGEFIQIQISDNGVGFDQTIIDMTNSVGLKNTKKRLEVFHKEAQLMIESQVNVGTTVTYLIPIEEGEQL